MPRLITGTQNFTPQTPNTIGVLGPTFLSSISAVLYSLHLRVLQIFCGSSESIGKYCSHLQTSQETGCETRLVLSSSYSFCGSKVWASFIIFPSLLLLPLTLN